MAENFEKIKDYPSGVVPFTRAVIPAANIISIGGRWIGYVQTIEEAQERPVTEQYEIGSVGVVEILPGQPRYSLSLEKVKVYKNSALQLFMEYGYQEKYGETAIKDAIQGQMVGDTANKNAEVFSLITHNILPFDIEVWELNYNVDLEGNPVDFVLDPASKSKLVTKWLNCWISRYSKPIAQGTINVVERMEITATRPKFEQG